MRTRNFAVAGIAIALSFAFASSATAQNGTQQPPRSGDGITGSVTRTNDGTQVDWRVRSGPIEAQGSHSIPDRGRPDHTVRVGVTVPLPKGGGKTDGECRPDLRRRLRLELEWDLSCSRPCHPHRTCLHLTDPCQRARRGGRPRFIDPGPRRPPSLYREERSGVGRIEWQLPAPPCNDQRLRISRGAP